MIGLVALVIQFVLRLHFLSRSGKVLVVLHAEKEKALFVDELFSKIVKKEIESESHTDLESEKKLRRRLKSV